MHQQKPNCMYCISTNANQVIEIFINISICIFLFYSVNQGAGVFEISQLVARFNYSATE